ncbi:hypothetical protein GPECTOR_90g520 [Gonium pectorale]|uniref:BTB domain-containing protein n=1 Tax=Gonium pectorale TaxID=33097 RepID=A0A150G0R7_GONPE|nr:hypothetical protein GPECTOR_90g520 [Gonium pectorale]|eukprot:KXZ43434.1 hypothetical protein GPECTOR_90g520 [Gonium pectorale]
MVLQGSFTSVDLSMRVWTRVLPYEAGPVQQTVLGRLHSIKRAKAPTYLSTDNAIYRLSSDNLVTLVAGHPEEAGRADGPASSARFACAAGITADGAGTLFVLDDGRVRRVQLPRTWLAATDGAAVSAALPSGTGGAEAQVRAEVTTLAASMPPAQWRLCCVSDGGKALPPAGALIVSSDTALYRMPLGDPGAGLELWAGQEGQGGGGALDGRGQEACFHDIMCLAAGGDGCFYGMDELSCHITVRKVDPSGAVTTIASDLQLSPFGAAILPNGYLALLDDDSLCVLDLGLPPARDIALPPAAAAPSPAARTLPGDLGALLDRQPDGTADLEVVVGDRTFAVHRALVRPVAELADRLLLPELCRKVQAQVLAEVGPESVVDAMLWAEGRGPGFSQLLAGLKAWCLEHYEGVMGAAEDSLERLSAAMPSVMVWLAKGYMGRCAKRPRPA